MHRIIVVVCLLASAGCAKGEKGDPGAQGPQGLQGVKGDTGAQGPAGTWAGTGASLVTEINGAMLDTVLDGGVQFARVPIRGAAAWKIAGVVTTTAGSAEVLGVGTSFGGEIKVGDALRIGSTVYTVSAITDATHLSISPNATESLAGVEAFRDVGLLRVTDANGVLKMLVDGHGNVGVGTTPRYTLDVAGSLRADGVRIFKKGGYNNGSVSCDTYCQGSSWGGGEVGACVAAQNITTGAFVPCSTVVGGGQGANCACLVFDSAP